MSRYLTHICFEPRSLVGVQILDLISRHDVGFVPETIRSSKQRRDVSFTDASRADFADVGVDDWLRIEAGSGRLGLSGVGGKFQQILWSTERAPDEALIEDATAMPGFNAALVGDADDVFWQSADQVNTYDVHGRSHDHLPKAWDEVFGRDKIDISANPGRRVALPLMWLWAAAHMWFGPGAFRVLDRGRLLEFPGDAISEGPNGTIRVDLFSSDMSIDQIRERQRAFRDWMGYDEIEERAPELRELITADPHVELEEGEFDHGGVRRVVEWLDADLESIRRSAASQRRVTELGEDGSVLWSVVEAIDS